jgi:hypothetical protein
VVISSPVAGFSTEIVALVAPPLLSADVRSVALAMISSLSRSGVA